MARGPAGQLFIHQSGQRIQPDRVIIQAGDGMELATAGVPAFFAAPGLAAFGFAADLAGAGFAAFGFDFFNEPDCGEIGFDLANLASRSEVVSSFDYMVFVRGVFCDFAFSTFFNVAMISRIIFSLMGICSGSSGQ